MDDPGKFQYPVSPYALIFPGMAPEDFQRLVDDVGRQGLIEAAAVLGEEVVDGHLRVMACDEAGVTPRFVHLPPETDPVAYVLAKNVLRRNLTQSQKAIVAYRLWGQLKRGRPSKEQENGEHPHRTYTQEEIAALLGVSRREVCYAARIYAPESGVDPEVLQAVEHGKISVSDVIRVIGETQDVQSAALAKVRGGGATTIARAVRQVKGDMSRQKEDTQKPESAPSMPAGEGVTLYHAAVSDLHKLVAPASVHAIITNPPAHLREAQVFSELSAFAAHALRPEGVMAVLAYASNLPQVIGGLQHPDLRFVLEYDVQFNGILGTSDFPSRVNLRRRPLLVYAKTGFPFPGGDDVIIVPPLEEHSVGQGLRHSVQVGMAMVVQRFTRPGYLVCDPWLLGRAGTALGAVRSGCTFIGASSDRSSRDLTLRRLSEAEAAVGSEPAGNPPEESSASTRGV